MLVNLTYLYEISFELRHRIYPYDLLVVQSNHTFVSHVEGVVGHPDCKSVKEPREGLEPILRRELRKSMHHVQEEGLSKVVWPAVDQNVSAVYEFFERK